MLFFYPSRQCPHWFVCAVALLIALLCFSACSDASPSAISHITPTTQSTSMPPGTLVIPGFLTVGSYTSYPPQEEMDPTTNTAIGFDIDLISAIARHMNLKTKIISTDFQSIINNLQAGNFDVVISAVSITPELQAKANFVPYFSGGESLLVGRGNPQGISTLKDLCGQKVAVRIGTLEQNDLAIANDFCQQNGKHLVTIIASQTQSAMIQLLLNKNVVATYQDSPVTDYAIKQYPTLVESAGSVVNANLEGIVIRKGNTAMLKQVQTALNALEANGTYCALITKWGLTSGVLTANNHRVC